jgi:hypothetical protein
MNGVSLYPSSSVTGTPSAFASFRKVPRRGSCMPISRRASGSLNIRSSRPLRS